MIFKLKKELYHIKMKKFKYLVCFIILFTILKKFLINNKIIINLYNLIKQKQGYNLLQRLSYSISSIEIINLKDLKNN